MAIVPQHSLSSVTIEPNLNHQPERRRFRLITNIAKVQAGVSLVAFIAIPIVTTFLIAKPELNWLLIAVAWLGLGNVISWVTAKKSANVGAYSLIVSTMLSIITTLFLVGADSPAAGIFLWNITLIGLVSTKRTRDITVSSIVFIALLLGCSFLEQNGILPASVKADSLAGLYNIMWIYTIIAVGLGIWIFGNSVQQALQQLESRAQELGNTVESLQTTGKVGQEVSRSLASITNELGATSRQQASGATEQVSAIVEATSSLEELGETAQHIADNSAQVAHAAEQSLNLAREIEARSEFLNNLTERGQTSITAVVNAIEAVRNRIESLAQRLLVLTERSKEIGNIIDLMRDIADETHMLALNAAIESADGKASGNGSDSGRRFGVIAGEVKNLADRSLESAQDVQKVILEVQGAIATAVLAAEEGKKETIKAVNQAYTSGQVIQDLGQAVEAAVLSSSQIVQAVTQVGTLSDEITLATRQQGSASEQVVLTMRTIQQVAQEGATGVNQVANTVKQIGELSRRLQSIFDQNPAPEPTAEYS
jgi:methyl-accepting chemotaxis protein